MLDTLRLALFHVSSWLARLLILAMISIAPWWYGGAQWQAQSWLVVAGLWLAGLTWLSALLSPRRTAGCIRLSYVMLAFMLLAVMQVAPLPGFLNGFLSGSSIYVTQLHQVAADSPPQLDAPATLQPAPEESTWTDQKRHTTASIAPMQSRASLAVLAVAVVMLWSAATLFLSARWAITLATVLAVGGVLNGFVGLLQLVNFAQTTLLPMPSTESVFATFVSRNSAPGYYAVCIGATFVVLGTAFRSQKRKRRQEYRVTYPGTSWLGRLRNRLEDVFIDLNSTAVTCMCVVVFMMVAILATSSRGGIIACAGASLVTICLTLGSRGNLPRAATVAGVTILGIIALMSFLEIGKPILGRLDQINEAIHTGDDARLVVWRYCLEAMPSYWLLGCGLGSFRFAILPYQHGGPTVWFHHAESLPLEVLIEMGVPGLAILVAAAWLVGRQLYVQSGLQKEQLLLAGALFASCAIAIQSLVDFSLILPGVFLPYCALLGTFLGRCRRVEQDQARLDELGVDAFDARKLARLGVRTPTRGKLIGHSLIGGLSLLCLAIGYSPLAGYSEAGKLADLLKNNFELVPEADFDQQFQYINSEASKLTEATKAALERYPWHAEVGLVAAQAEHVLWRISATTSIDWGNSYPTKTKWDFANPTTLAMVARSSDPNLKPLRDAILDHDYGTQLATSSFARFQRALSACPLDARAAWGAYSGNLGWLAARDTYLLLTNLEMLTGNNPAVMTEIGLLALRDGYHSFGLKLVGRAVSLDPSRLNRNTLKAIAGEIKFEQLAEFFSPGDLVQMASTAKILSELTLTTNDPLPAAGPLAQQLLDMVYQKLDKPIEAAVGLDGYETLAWVARQKQDAVLEVRFLEQLSRLAPEDPRRRIQYASMLHQLGKKEEAIGEIRRFLNNETPTAAVRQQCDNLLKNWLGSVDPNTGTGIIP